MRHVRSLILRYDAALKRRPLPVKALTSAAIVTAADTTVQSFSPEAYNYRRTAAAAAYGGLLFAPVMHTVFAFWARAVPSQTIGATVFKVCVDMGTSFPVNISALMALQALAKAPPVGGDESRWQQAKHVVPAALRENFWGTYTDGLKFWPPVTVGLYTFVPVLYRVLALNVFSYGWNCWLIFRQTSESSLVEDSSAGRCRDLQGEAAPPS